ncbi:MAG: hypothetical protein IKW90_12135 [Lachnospiraceae bacterium]|nr:hypothetical protein [Lachnospiraceae bacterium]
MNRHEEFVRELRKYYYKMEMLATQVKKNKPKKEDKLTESELFSNFVDLFDDDSE